MKPSQSIIRRLRYVLLPFPVAIALSFAVLVATDYIMRPDRSGIEFGGPTVFIGSVAILVLTIVLQALWGIPSLLLLDSWRRGFSSYAVTGVASSALLSLGFAAILRSPQFGETLQWMFWHVMLFFGISLSLSYMLAAIVSPDAKQNT